MAMAHHCNEGSEHSALATIANRTLMILKKKTDDFGICVLPGQPALRVGCYIERGATKG